jgi:hypothetical protein
MEDKSPNKSYATAKAFGGGRMKDIHIILLLPQLT